MTGGYIGNGQRQYETDGNNGWYDLECFWKKNTRSKCQTVISIPGWQRFFVLLIGGCLLLSQFWIPVVQAEESQSFWDQYKDPEDGKFDIIGSKDLATGFLPVIIPFNEPAVGFGAVGAVAYFHPRADQDSSVGNGLSSVPPSTSFGGGLYSENETWAVAGGHLGVWKKGRIRYLGAVVYASVNLDYYGVGNDSENNRNPIPFNIEGGGTLQQAEFQLGDSRFFAGTRYEFSSTNGSFQTDQFIEDEGQSQNAGLGIYLSYDSRDNIFTPNSGTKVTASSARYDTWLGGDYTYNRWDFRFNRFWEFREKFILGVRLEYRNAGHDAPFYALPWVRLRGIPAFRYLGHHVVITEIEPRWKIDGRWSLLAFTGAGRAASNFDLLKDAERAYNYGLGFRYLVARRLGLTTGLDFAQGPEGSTVYPIAA